jgi:hypothetical protein
MSTEYVTDQLSEGFHLIPEHMHGGVSRYVMHGIPMGDFGRLILSNDFMGAVGRADQDNRDALANWAIFLYNYVPGGCKGSPERVADWIKSGGIVGQQSEMDLARKSARS